MIVSTLLAFAIPAVLTHFGVTAGLTAVLGATGGGIAARAASTAAAAAVKQLIQHIHDGHPVTDQQRAWLQANSQELYLLPKLQPGQPPRSPDMTWGTPAVR